MYSCDPWQLAGIVKGPLVAGLDRVGLREANRVMGVGYAIMGLLCIPETPIRPSQKSARPSRHPPIQSGRLDAGQSSRDFPEMPAW